MNSKIAIVALLLSCGLLSSVSGGPATFLENCKELEIVSDTPMTPDEQDIVACADGLMGSKSIWHLGVNSDAMGNFGIIERGLNSDKNHVCSRRDGDAFEILDCMGARAVQVVGKEYRQGVEQIKRQFCPTFQEAAVGAKYMLLVTRAMGNSRVLKALAATNGDFKLSMSLYLFCTHLSESNN